MMAIVRPEFHVLSTAYADSEIGGAERAGVRRDRVRGPIEPAIGVAAPLGSGAHRLFDDVRFVELLADDADVVNGRCSRRARARRETGGERREQDRAKDEAANHECSFG